MKQGGRVGKGGEGREVEGTSERMRCVCDQEGVW